MWTLFCVSLGAPVVSRPSLLPRRSLHTPQPALSLMKPSESPAMMNKYYLAAYYRSNEVF